MFSSEDEEEEEGRRKAKSRTGASKRGPAYSVMPPVAELDLVGDADRPASSSWDIMPPNPSSSSSSMPSSSAAAEAEGGFKKACRPRLLLLSSPSLP